MRPRILLNLVSFAVLGVVMVIWALTSIISVDAIRRPFMVTAEFDSSPGLRPDLEVAYLGVKVGSVENVELATGKVIVSMHLDRGVTVPSNAEAAVLRKSAVGEPYIAMSPPKGAPGRPFKQGDKIPLERTSVAVEYKRLFEAVGGLLKAVKPEDAKTLIHELSLGLEGRGDTLRDLIGDTHQLTGTLAENSKLLDELAVQLTALGEVLADGGPELAGGLNGLAAFQTSLGNNRAKLDGILTKGPGFLDNVTGLLEASRPGLSCLLSALGMPSQIRVFSERNSGLLRHALGLTTNALPALANDVVTTTPKGNTYARVSMVITAAGPVPAAKQYLKPLAGPKEPQLYYCTKAYEKQPDSAQRKAIEKKAKQPGAGTQAAGAFTEVEAPKTTEAVNASGSSPLNTWLPLIPIVLAAGVLALTARRTLRVARRRFGR